jgi:glycosyltransferase involved in cell wall biosynthesis
MPSPSDNGIRRSVGRTISVVIPVHNEQDDIAPLIGEIDVALSGQQYEILVVDDRSTDRTVDHAAGAAALNEHVRILRLGVRSGKAAALAAGFREARGDIIATMDGDRQDDPANLLPMIAHLDSGFDVVSGWKVPRRDPWRRRVASKAFNWAVRRISGLLLHDVNCGMKVYTSAAVTAIVEDCVGDMHRFLPVFAHARGYRIGELQISHRRRENGASRYGVARYAHGVLDLAVALIVARFSQRPMHALGGAGLFAALVGTITAVATAFTTIGGRFLPFAAVALFLIAVQLFLAGLVAEAIVHRHRWPIAYSSVLTLPADHDYRRHAPLSIVRSTSEVTKERI